MNKIVFNKVKIAPSKVVCIGRNYIEHIKELNNELPSSMVFFNKANSSITDKLMMPKIDSACHYEAEISFLIENDEIAGLAFGLDLTLRDIQTELKNKGLPWERAKSFDASAVFSNFVEFKDDISKLGIELFINNELRQKADFSMMIHKPRDIIKEFKTFSSFEDGDILMSGTPKGVGKLIKGDIFLGKILYENRVILEQEFIVS